MAKRSSEDACVEQPDLPRYLFSPDLFEDSEEKKIHCSDCGAYLWSVSVYEDGANDVPCPCTVDPCGKCTGVLRKSKRSVEAVGKRLNAEACK